LWFFVLAAIKKLIQTIKYSLNYHVSKKNQYTEREREREREGKRET
jgi:hypothetical protein